MKNKKPMILFYDIETTPMRAYIWRTGKQYVDQSSIVEGDITKIICIAYKWDHENKVNCLVWDMRKQNCDKIVDQFGKILIKADVAIAHNGDSFDVRHINTQRLLSGKPPLAWPTTEDSLKQLRQVFKFPSFKLNYVAKLLLGKGKSPMVFKDWLNIVERRDPIALDKMVKYCKRDVKIMAEAYEILRPFLKPKVSRAQITNGSCDSCGSSHVHKKGTITLRSGQYPRFQCQKCGHFFRAANKIKEEDK